jgi:hypothetical protein
MNIFVLDRDPVQAARMHCDKHVVKMVLETAQLLSTASRRAGSEPDHPRMKALAEAYMQKHMPLAYKPTHVNHPCTKWATSNSVRWRWLYQLGKELCKEYTYRYGKVHKSQAVIESLHFPLFDSCWIEPDLEPFVLAMPDQYKTDDPVESYRNYYLNEKLGLLYYTKRKPPDWLEGIAERKY